MCFGKKEYCPFCGIRMGFLKIRTKDGIAVCTTCFSELDMEMKLIRHQSIDTLARLRQERYENHKVFQDFTVTSEVKAGLHILRMDAFQKLWYVSKQANPANPTIFRFDELAKFELLQDGDSVCGGGIGLSLVGGALFGSAGAVAGAVAGGKKTKKILNSLEVVITTSRPYRTCLRLNLLPHGSSCKSGSMIYKQCMKEATDVMSLLNAICEGGDKEPSMAEPTRDVADTLLKYKTLLDSGVLTEEEFNRKKKELLQ